MTTPARGVANAPKAPKDAPSEPSAVESLRGAAVELRGAVAFGRTVVRVVSDDWPKPGDSFPGEG